MPNDNDTENIYTKFIARYPQYRLNQIAKALGLSRHQLYRLYSGKTKILNYRVDELQRLDHYLRYDGNIDDFEI